MITSNSFKALPVCLLMTMSGQALAQANVSIQTSAEVEVTEVDDNGETVTKLVPAAKVIPGDIVIYTVTFANEGSEVAENVAVINPVPRYMAYVAGTAFGPGTDISFSVDGGETWGAPDELTIPLADGGERPATADDFTDIKWILKNPLQPGAQGFARFRARVE